MNRQISFFGKVDYRSEYPEVDAMLKRIEGAFKKHFPFGFINTTISKSMANKDVYLINTRFGMIGDKKDLDKGYRENDPMDISVMITPANYKTVKSKEDNFNPDVKYTIESIRSSEVTIKPDPNSYMALDGVKIPFRKVTNSILKLEKTLIKYVENMAKTVKSIPYSKINFDGREVPEKYYKTVKV